MGLFPNSGFAVPVPSFPNPVIPPEVEPNQGPVATIEVSCEWLPYIRGALLQLTLQATWDGDLATVNLAQDRANKLITMFGGTNPCDCGIPCPPVAGGEDVEMSQLRVDCNCNVFVTCCDGTEVQLLTTKSPGIAQSQPGAGSTPAAPNGGSQQYCGGLQGQGIWLLPFTVNSGDVLNFSDLKGVWTDTRSFVWYCPDGYAFFDGDCFGYPAGSFPSDPINTLFHMSIIANIGGTYYDVLNLDAFGNPQPFTVPPGIVNQNVILLANTDSRPDTSGFVNFCVEWQNNKAAAWVHEFDFASSAFGFANNPAVAVGPSGAYTPGTGWTETGFQEPAANYYIGVDITSINKAGTYLIDEIDMTYDLVAPIGAPAGGDDLVLIAAHSGATIAVTAAAAVAGTGQILALTGLSEHQSDMRLFCANQYGGAIPPVGGHSRITHLTVKGTGIDPWL